MAKDQAIASVLETMDYAKFKFSNLNRFVDKTHVNNLKNSMKKGYILDPINCGPDFVIQDGQHRYTAAKELGLPIRYYIGGKLKPIQIAEMNSITKKWSNDDYAKTYAHQGNENYKVYRAFRTKYPDISHAITLILLTNDITRKKGNEQNFKLGTFVVQNETKALKMAEKLMEIKKYTDVYSRVGFILALLYINDLKGFDMDRLVRKLKHKGTTLRDFAQRDDFIRELERMYNWKEGDDNKMRFFDYL